MDECVHLHMCVYIYSFIYLLSPYLLRNIYTCVCVCVYSCIHPYLLRKIILPKLEASQYKKINLAIPTQLELEV